jgi:hypothetical protein
MSDLTSMYPVVPYVYREYPKALTREGQSCAVQTAEERAARLAEGWQDPSAPPSRKARKVAEVGA